MPPLPPLTRLTAENNPVNNPPGYMTAPEKARVRAAALRAPRLYPGPVGAVLARELFAWEEFGWRLAHDALITKLVDHILSAEETAA